MCCAPMYIQVYMVLMYIMYLRHLNYVVVGTYLGGS